METKNLEGLPLTQARMLDDRGGRRAEHGKAPWLRAGLLAGDANVCHLQCLEESVNDLSLIEKLYGRTVRRGIRRAGLIMAAARRLILQSRWKGLQMGQGASQPAEPGRLPPLGLRPGERVMVKTLDEILKTLDQNGKYQGLSFTVAQRKYCGGTYTVLKRLEKVFDERRWKLSRIKDTVLLDSVVCDGDGGVSREWDGCDRHCLLWWKEAWLKRVEGPPAEGAGG
ncbi:MAG: hypothetical protein WAR22_06520 [Desulfomonilia bacterium]|jgi:hypothetical protein